MAKPIPFSLATLSAEISDEEAVTRYATAIDILSRWDARRKNRLMGLTGAQGEVSPLSNSVRMKPASMEKTNHEKIHPPF